MGRGRRLSTKGGRVRRGEGAERTGVGSVPWCECGWVGGAERMCVCVCVGGGRLSTMGRMCVCMCVCVVGGGGGAGGG